MLTACHQYCCFVNIPLFPQGCPGQSQERDREDRRLHHSHSGADRRHQGYYTGTCTGTRFKKLNCCRCCGSKRCSHPDPTWRSGSLKGKTEKKLLFRICFVYSDCFIQNFLVIKKHLLNVNVSFFDIFGRIRIRQKGSGPDPHPDPHHWLLLATVPFLSSFYSTFLFVFN